MPRSRGGPCDKLGADSARALKLFLCRVLAAVPATVHGRESGRVPLTLFLCRVLAAVPATAIVFQDWMNGKNPFLCRVLAAVPATFLDLTEEVMKWWVSMPRSRGGPCDSGYCMHPDRVLTGFYAAFSRRSLRRDKGFVLLAKLFAGFYAAFSRRSLRRGRRPQRQQGRNRFYAAFSRRSLRRGRTSHSKTAFARVSMPRSRGGPCDFHRNL